MKRFAAYGFVFLYLLAMVRPVLPLAEYIVYEDYIAEFLCINKDNIELQCKGKCYLMQRLSEKNEQKKQNLPKIALEEYPIGFVELMDNFTEEQSQIESNHDFNYCNSYSFLFLTSSFHPPNTLT
ncbi:MAG: hypothetical protein AB3N18_07525 [Allomuricauda sp.]